MAGHVRVSFPVSGVTSVAMSRQPNAPIYEYVDSKQVATFFIAYEMPVTVLLFPRPTKTGGPHTRPRGEEITVGCSSPLTGLFC